MLVNIHQVHITYLFITKIVLLRKVEKNLIFLEWKGSYIESLRSTLIGINIIKIFFPWWNVFSCFTAAVTAQPFPLPNHLSETLRSTVNQDKKTLLFGKMCLTNTMKMINMWTKYFTKIKLVNLLNKSIWNCIQNRERCRGKKGKWEQKTKREENEEKTGTRKKEMT